jgi:polysaccharide deacetylase 2 family uncharacterized protein YibQ
MTHMVEDAGGAVLRGRESWASNGALMVTLLVGMGSRATHEVTLVRAVRADTDPPEPGRLAVVLYGFGESATAADSFFTLPVPFAVAVEPGGRGSAATFRAAHKRSREVVLHLPLEPINYPRVNPGPGTLLVTMKPTKVASEVRHYLDQGRPVAAVANHMGSLATQDMAMMGAVYRELKRSNMPFVHVNPTAGAVCKSLASQMGIAYQEPDAVIEGETRGNETAALDKRWKALLQEARTRDRMTVWVRATPLTWRWLPRALDPSHLEGVNLVPLSSLVRRPPAFGR